MPQSKEEVTKQKRCCLHPVARAVTEARPLMPLSLLTPREREREREKQGNKAGEGGGEQEGVGGDDIQIQVKHTDRTLDGKLTRKKAFDRKTGGERENKKVARRGRGSGVRASC